MATSEGIMVETLFQAVFVLALALPSLAVLAGVVLMVVPRLHWTRHVTNAPVHP
jgi:hypothetical protein